jgi:hypothetical protein
MASSNKQVDEHHILAAEEMMIHFWLRHRKIVPQKGRDQGEKI